MSMPSPRKSLSLILISSSLLFAAACDKDSEAPTEVAVEKATANLKQEAAKRYEAATPQDCPTFAKMLAEACADVIDKRLPMPCSNTLIAFNIANKQADGKLFETGAEDTNKRAAAALCSKGVDDLRAAREKTSPAGGDVKWSSECNDFFATLRKDCIAKIPSGTQAEHCENTFRMVEQAARMNDDGAISCAMAVQMLLN
jgi:hypothetical protein